VSALSSPLLVAAFAAFAGAIWIAGTYLSRATNALDGRLGLGSAFGGLILLAIATNLPETAITVSAASSGKLDLAVGNLVGGIAIQTVVLAALDARTRGRPLTFYAGSLMVVLEASLVIATLIVAIMTTQLPATTQFGGLSPGTAAIALVWMAGLFVINRARKGLPWRAEAIDAKPGRASADRARGKEPVPLRSLGTRAVAGLFALAALVTLGAGVGIEESGSELAGRVGLSGAVFGATILAASTALPELSTGFASIKLGDHQLAFSDIFGGNAFLPVLFVVADLVAGAPALPTAAPTDLWMAGLGVALTVVYAAGILFRPQRQYGVLGPDSLVALGIYALGIVGLFAIA
jgi:cation:H+ antiporter